MYLILIIVLLVILVGAFPTGPWWHTPRTWGYGPSGLIGIILVVLVILLLLGRL